jgi:microcystin-dependent protein
MEHAKVPSDSNGVYSLPDGYLAITGETIQPSQHNPPLEDIASSMTQRMMRSGATPMIGPLKLADGTVSSPGATFNSASGTGVYKTADGLGISVNGTQVGEFTAGGLTKGGGRYIGELITWTGTTAPPRCVLPYGQTLSRTTYADLWAFAQLQIAAGNLFYNNGDGSTTFGVGDLRGRTVAAPDNMGGSTANRLLNGGLAAQRHSVGGSGGEDVHVLTASESPSITSSGSASVSVTSRASNILLSDQVALQTNVGGSNPVKLFNFATNQSLSSIISDGTGSASVTSNNTGGGAHNNMQPTILCNYALYAGA